MLQFYKLNQDCNVPSKKVIFRLMSVIGLVLLVAFQVAAQSKNIRGIVKDAETDLGLPGVTIQATGSSNGTVSDVNGNYNLSVDEGTTLSFSFVGYVTKTIVVGAEEVININLELDLQSLEEVVIVDYGYGKVKKTDFTGSVASLSGENISKIPVSDVSQALAGRLPGVSVLSTDGSPGAEVVIRVRGGGSITQDNSPLFVVDGFIVSSINDIPPSDIETMTVLKDAASTAIYGAQAANGVIVITTKTPQAGRVSVSLNSFVQAKYLPENRKYEVLSPYEFALANYEYNKLRSDADLRKFEKFFGTYDDLELYKNKQGTDWQDEVFGDTRFSQYHNINISGGSEMTLVNLSLSHNDDKGQLSGSEYERSVINFKLIQNLGSKLKFDANARLTHSILNGAGTSSTAQLNVKNIIQTRPINGIADELESGVGSLSGDDDYADFLQNLITPSQLLEQDWRKRTENSYVLSGGLNYEIIDGLNLKSTLTSETRFRETLRFYGPETGESFNNGGNLPLGHKTDRKSTTLRWLNTVQYSFPVFADTDHDLKVLAGHETYSSGGDEQFLRAEDFRLTITPDELFSNMAFGRVDRHSTTKFTESNRLSFFSRVDYQYKGKYLATFTMRSDASSKFSAGNRRGIFPAAALAWQISKEPFLNKPAIDDLKLRVSYGSLGNDRVSANASRFLLEASTNRGPGFNNFDNTFYRPESNVLYNPDIIWETTISRNIGIDFSFFQSRISGSIDAYYNTTKDLLLQSAIPSNTGFSFQWANLGSTSNRGIELGLTGYLIDRNDLSVSMNINAGINRGKIEELDGTSERFVQSNWASSDLNGRDDFYLQVGGTVGDVYGYVTDGFYTTSDFDSYDEVTDTYILKEGVADASSLTGNSNIRPGFMKVEDINDDGVISDLDRRVIGNTLPKAQGGFGINTTFKGFDFSVFFNWSYGNDIYNTNKIQFNQFRRVTYGNLLNTMNSSDRFTYIDIDGSFTEEAGGIVTDLEQLNQLNAGKTIWSHNSFGIANAVVHSWAIEDGSFIRLNQVSLGYSLPASILDKIGISRFRIYVTGNNLHVWTNYTGYDPEVNTSRSSQYQGLTPGVDYSSYPRSRSFTAGLNVTF